MYQTLVCVLCRCVIVDMCTNVHNVVANNVLISPLPQITAHCFLSFHSIKSSYFVGHWAELTWWKCRPNVTVSTCPCDFIKVVT